jgi:hypothetical protein
VNSNKKYQLSNKVEFYITNVCNLACEQCNRFNNFNFTGWQRWSDYEADYQKLGEYIDLSAIVLLGGEPLLNPTVVDWIRGLNGIFSADIQLLTNGTRLNKVAGLYDALAASPRGRSVKNHVGLSLHNPAHFDSLREAVHKFLQGPITEWGPMIKVERTQGQPDFGAIYSARDSNRVLVNMFQYTNFVTASVQQMSGRFVLHNSDPKIAHDNCGFVKYKSYHFIRGKMYKCGPVALFPEFDQQHTFDISSKDRELLNSYKPLTAENIETYGDEFFANIDNPIPQCKFCPEMSEGFVINAEPKGPKLI